MEAKIEQALERLSRAIDEYKPIAVFGLFSGGHDSFSSTYIASLHPVFTGAVHVNTGIGVPATRTYVRETCAQRNWKLFEYKATENIRKNGTPNPQIYAWFVRRFGFPGPGGHQFMYNHLKARQLERLERDFGATTRGKSPKRVMYVSGCRSQESTRRMANTEEMQVRGRTVWVAPIHDWSKLDTTKLLTVAEQPRNLIVDLIHKSGECLCGAYAKPGELEELGVWPQTRPVYDRIKKLEAELIPKFGYGWEDRPLKKPDPRQTVMFDITTLCWSCDKYEPVASELKDNDVTQQEFFAG